MKRNCVILVGMAGLTLACGGESDGEAVVNTNTDSSSIIALGDSIMAWNSEARASIADVVGQRLSVTVDNRSVGGAHFLGSPEGIPTQFVDGGWSWLIFTGGGNDLAERCGCGDCAATMDQIVSADGSRGAMPEFIDQVRSQGVNVAYVAYYELPVGARFGFDECGEELATLRTRAAQMAAAREGVILVDASQAVSATDLSQFEDDRVHPSISGSAAVGVLVADQIRAAGL